MKKYQSDKTGPDEIDVTEDDAEERPFPSFDCEICGERLGARDVWRKGVWFGRLCPDCEREGRRGVSRSRPAD